MQVRVSTTETQDPSLHLHCNTPALAAVPGNAVRRSVAQDDIARGESLKQKTAGLEAPAVTNRSNGSIDVIGIKFSHRFKGFFL